MKVLLDTNIIIPLEDTGRLLSPELADLCRLSESLGFTFYIHPSQRDDIARDRDHARRDIVLSRVDRYQSIPAPPEIQEEEVRTLRWTQSSDNDRIDNLLLQAVRRNAVHLLVSDDDRVHRKARAAQIQENVYLLSQFLALLRSQIAPVDVEPPFGIQERYLHEFDVRQTFFDSLRDGYQPFDTWYKKSAADHRKAWCVTRDDSLQAICIHKLEAPQAITDDGLTLDGEALKLCTFKVSEAVRGRKLGERLLFAAFTCAAKNRIPYVYLHTFGPEHEMLVSLCLDYGFKNVGKYGADDVYLKRMIPPCDSPPGLELDALQYAVDYYPNYQDHAGVRKFIVPIVPRWHNDLFADTSDTAQGLFADDPDMYGPQSNTIKKAYLCHSNVSTMRPGDIVLFYRSKDRRSMECVGIVEKTHRSQDVSEVLPLVSKRTVFSRLELEEILTKETLVILFRFAGTIGPFEQKDLDRAGVRGAIQTIRQISHEQYLAILNRSS